MDDFATHASWSPAQSIWAAAKLEALSEDPAAGE
jgi:hypothetical protein